MRRSTRTIRVLLLAALLAAFGACTGGDAEGETTDPDTQEAVSDEERIFDDPAAFEGREVRMIATVDEVVHAKLFLIAADDPNGDRYLVIHDPGADLEEGEEVEITGTVEEIDVFDLEEDLDVDLEMPTLEPYEGDYAIVAEDVEA